MHILLTILGATNLMLPALFAQQSLATGERIEIQQGSQWIRGSVSSDAGPSSPTMKVRKDPGNELAIVPRKSVRLAPRPASIKTGDRVEWFGNSSTSFRYVPATVKGVGTGNMQGYYLVAWDKYPNSPTYTKPEQLWSLPRTTAAAAPAGEQPTPGKYRCFVYGAPRSPGIFLAAIELDGGGRYSVNGKPGRYAFDAASKSITWLDGWGKTNGFEGAVEGNATIRLKRNTVCSHE